MKPEWGCLMSSEQQSADSRIAAVRPSSARRQLVLGTAYFGSQLSEDESFAQLDQFAESGGDILDTAHIYGAWAADGVNAAEDGYGNSEVVIGRWIRSRGMQGKVTVASKGGHPTFAEADSCLTEQGMQQHVDDSLRRLQLDHIPIYFFHRDDPAIPVADMLSWLAPAVNDGRLGVVGCSHWRPERMCEAIVAGQQQGVPVLGANQVSWSFVQTENTVSHNKYGEQLVAEQSMWDFHKQEQLPLFAYNAQAAGFFAQKYDGVDMLAADFPKPGLVKKYAHQPINLERRARAQQLATEFGVSTNQIALAWLLHQPFPVYPLVAPRTAEQMADSLAAVTVELSSGQVSWLAGDSVY